VAAAEKIYYPADFLERLRKAIKISVRITGLRVGI
jgi:hypothetical protein